MPGKSHGPRSLGGYSPWGRKESDMAERLHFTSLYYISYSYQAFLVAQLVKNPPARQETLVQFLSGEDPLEKGRATRSNILGLPWWLRRWGIHLQGGRPGLIPGLGRSAGGGHGHPLQCSCLENPMDRRAGGLRGAWQAAVHGVTKSQAWMSDFSHRASLVARMVKNLPAVRETWGWSLGWEDPWRSAWQPTPVFLSGDSWTEGPGGLPSMGLQRARWLWMTKHYCISYNYQDCPQNYLELSVHLKFCFKVMNLFFIWNAFFPSQNLVCLKSKLHKAFPVDFGYPGPPRFLAMKHTISWMMYPHILLFQSFFASQGSSDCFLNSSWS